MLKVISEPGIEVYAITHDEFTGLRDTQAPEGCRYAFVMCNDASFNYPIWLKRWFLVVYHASRKFNMEAMKLPDLAPSLKPALDAAEKRSAYREFYANNKQLNANACIATQFLKPGWKSSYWLGLVAEEFAKLPPAAETCKTWQRHIARPTLTGRLQLEGRLEDLHIWLHPTENRALHTVEVSEITGQPIERCHFDNILAGDWLQPPERVLQWLNRNVGFYSRNVWVQQRDLQAVYIRKYGNPKGEGFETLEVTSGTKTFDFSRYDKF